MNVERMQPSGNRFDRETTTKKRIVYQVDATKLCDLVRRGEQKSFIEFLHLASIDSIQDRTSVEQSDFISIAIHWIPSQCTTRDIEDLVSIIDPWISLDQLFNHTPNSSNEQVNLIGLICFYATTIEVFFAYDNFTSKWLFCFDGKLISINDWNGVRRKSIDYHLQPFLLIYAHSPLNSINITPLLQRTILKTNVVESSIDDTKQVMTHDKQSLKKTFLQRDFYSFDNLSSFASLNSSMLFMPQTPPTATTPPSTDYINEEIVARVMQQQLLKKESSLVETPSSSCLRHHRQLQIRHDRKQMTISDETLSSGDSSTSSQRDSGLSSSAHDGCSDDSSRDSLMEIDVCDDDHHRDSILTSIEYYLEQSLKYESASNYSSAMDACQHALTLLEQIHRTNIDLTVYTQTRKNSLLLRIRSLKTRQFQSEQWNSNGMKTSILSTNTGLTRPKKNVKFSDHVALIVPISDDSDEQPSEHLIHTFLRQFQKQPTTTTITTDLDSDIHSSSTDLLIGLKECSLCHKRFSLTNSMEIYCSNCQFYMQRFQPLMNKT